MLCFLFRSFYCLFLFRLRYMLILLLLGFVYSARPDLVLQMIMRSLSGCHAILNGVCACVSRVLIEEV